VRKLKILTVLMLLAGLILKYMLVVVFLVKQCLQ
jgi:hypothetical protein